MSLCCVIMLNVIMLSVIMLSVIMLSVIMLYVVMLSVVAPSLRQFPCHQRKGATSFCRAPYDRNAFGWLNVTMAWSLQRSQWNSTLRIFVIKAYSGQLEV
jgi:hypothetical protein